MTDEICALLAQMAKELDSYLQRTACDPKVVHPLATRARVAIAAHQTAMPAFPPQELTDAQLDALERQHWKVESNIEYEPGAGFVEALDKHETFQHRAYARAAIAAHEAALLQKGAPAPVPVAERPWEWHLWCDAEGRCWWFAPPEAIAGGFRSAGWGLYAGPPADEDTHCLPHWAIPHPTENNGTD